MSHPLTRFFLATLLLLESIASGAQTTNKTNVQPMSLNQAIQYGLDHHHSALNATDDIESAGARIREITSIGLPQIRATYGLTDNFIIQKVIIPNGQLFNPDAPPGPVALEFQPQYGGNANLTLTQLLFDGSYLVGLKAAQTFRQIAVKNREMTDAQISENVQKAYYGVLVGQHRNELLEASLMRLDSSLREMQIMLQNGLIERLDVQRVELQRNQLATEAAKIKQIRYLSLQLLKFQMGYPLGDTLILTDRLENIPSLVAEQVPPNYTQLEAFKARPEAALLDLQIKGNDLEIKNLKAGYLPVGDGDSGYEHYYKWSYLTDERVLDPAAPESLMYEVDFITGKRTLAAAAYILQGYTIDTLDQAPDVGGPLTQWHVHLDMCYDRDPFTFGSATLRGPISLLGGKCDPGFLIPTQTMMHVWVIPFDCGPFAALHGISSGEVAKGEEQMCTHEHGPKGGES